MKADILLYGVKKQTLWWCGGSFSTGKRLLFNDEEQAERVADLYDGKVLPLRVEVA